MKLQGKHKGLPFIEKNNNCHDCFQRTQFPLSCVDEFSKSIGFKKGIARLSGVRLNKVINRFIKTNFVTTGYTFELV